MMNNVYIKKMPLADLRIFTFLMMGVSFLFSFNELSAQQKTPGGGAGSYNLTEPTGNAVNYGPIGFGNEIFAKKGATYPGPFQTHNWWNSALWNVQYGRQFGGDMVNSKPMFPLPLMMHVIGSGIQFGYRTLDQQTEDGLTQTPGANARITDVGGKAYDLNMGIDGNVGSTSNVIADYGDWHAKFEQHFGATTMFTTVAKGNPFVFFEVTGAGANVVFNTNNEESQPRIVAKSNNSLLFNIYPDTIIKNGPRKSKKHPEGFYAFYFPDGTMLAGNDNNYKLVADWNVNEIIGGPLKVKLPGDGTGTFSMSVMPDGNLSTLKLFEPHGYCKITDTRFTYAYNPATARVTNTFTVSTTPFDSHANVGTMQVLFRHQYLYSPEALGGGTGLSYYGPKGEAKIIEGNVFNDIMTYYGSVPELGKAAKRFNEAQIVSLVNGLFAFSQYGAYKTANYDDYNYFRSIAIWTQAAEIAHQIKRPDLRDNLLDHAKMVIEDFLKSPDGDNIATVYSPEVNFMTTFPNSFNSYAGMYDYHFVVSYMAYACGMVAKFEKIRSGNLDWVQQYKPMVDLMIRNIDDYRREMTAPSDPKAPWFPYLRYFDPYAGHSWFANYCEAQEAVSESVLFATGAMMWGDVTDNDSLRDMGAMLYVTESEAGRQYWFNYDNADCIKGDFATDYPSTHAGIVEEDGYMYSTFYDPTQPNTAVAIHRASIMPITGSSVWLGTSTSGIDRDIASFNARQGGFNFAANTWSNEILAYQALSNAQAARAIYDQNVWSGNPPAQSLDQMLFPVVDEHWIATLDSVGNFDPTVQGDIPFFSVFVKDTCNTKMRHYMMYNSPGVGPNHMRRTVKFTDGTCWDLPEDTLIVYKLIAPDTIKTITATGGACESDSVKISITSDICPSRNPAAYYQYSTNNITWKTLYNVATIKDSMTVSFVPNTAGNYYFRAIMIGDSVPGLMCNAHNRDTSSVTMLTVNSCCPLKIDSVSRTAVTCSGYSNGKIVIHASNGAPAYKYSIDNGTTLSNSGTFSNLPAGTYHIYVKDINNCEKRVDAVVAALSSINITAKDSTNNKCFGEKKASASIAVSGGSGLGTYSYLWDDPKQQTTPKADTLYSGTYTVKVTDLNGCNISVKYNLPEAPQLNISSIDITKVDCFGNSTGALKANVTGGTPSYNYLWSNAATTATISSLPAANYTLKVTDQNGCIALSQAEVKSPALLLATINKSGENCFGAANSGKLKAVVTGGVKNYTYQWDLLGSGNVDSLSNLAGGTYNLIVTDANNCVVNATSTILQSTAITYSTSFVSPNCGQADGTATVTLTSGSTPVYTYLWDARAANQTTTTANNLGTGWYSFKITDGAGCVKNDSVEVKNLNGVNIISSAFTPPSCFGKCDGTAKITAQGGNMPYTYVWNLSSSTDSSASNLCAGNYTVTVTDQSLCSATKNFILKDPKELKLSIAPSVVSPMCVKGSVQISASATGGTGSSVPKWNADISISDVNKWNPVITPTAKTIYTLIAKDSMNCKDTATFTLQPMPVVNFTVDTIADCENIQATLSAVTTAISPYQTTWQIGNNSSTDPIAAFTFTPGTYPVKLLVQDANGCTDSVSQQLSFSVKNHPYADFDFSPQHITMVDPTIYFSNLSTNASTYKWTFGNGDSTSMTNPTYTYSDSGSYSVCLRAVNEYNCYMDTCVRIHIDGITVFYVPNAFTPGGDGRNEVFIPITSGLDANSYKLEIFNRWGELFFATNDLSAGWDGTYKGKVVQTDVYVWKIDFKEKDSKRKISKMGHVTVLR